MKFFWPWLAPERNRLAAMLVLLVFSAALPVAMGFLPQLLGRYWQPGQRRMLWIVLAGFLALSVVGIASGVMQALLTARITQGFNRRMRRAIFEKLGTLSRSAMVFRSVGSLAHRSTGDVAHMQEFLARVLPETVSGALQLVFLLVALLWQSPLFAALALVSVPLMWLLMERINSRVRRLARGAQQKSERALTRLIESIGGYIDLVASGRYGRATQAYDVDLEDLQRTAIRTTLWSAIGSVLTGAIFLAIVFGYYFTATGDETAIGDPERLGAIMTFAFLLTLARMPLMTFARAFTEAAVAAPSFHEVKALLSSPSVAQAGDDGRLADGSIEFRRVRFSYSPEQPPVLDDATFRVEPGSFTAIVGETGSGKTTLFHLLLRLLDPTAGEIVVGGSPLSRIPLAELRSRVGFIPQAPFLFDATIRENLCIAVEEQALDPARVERAVELAQLRPVVARRRAQGGLDAPVGAGGASLSGGERQRIALGRVFLRDPEIVVCDEYTANIDNATARLIHEALARQFAGRTRIVITHQLYSVRGADQILVLERGRITARGRHEELLAQPGLYREMWDVQRLG